MFQEKARVETPEHVAVEFEIAGPMTRLAAALYDLTIVGTVLLLVWIGLLFTGGGAAFRGGGLGSDITATVMLLASVGLLWGYFPLFEWFMDGQTPGKRACGIRVARVDGAPLDARAIFLRNVVRLLDMMPPPLHAVGLVTMVVSSRCQRFGDMAAGTWVLRERTSRKKRKGLGFGRRRRDLEAEREEESGSFGGDLVGEPGESGEFPAAVGVAGATGRLTAEEHAIVERFLQRRLQLPTAVRHRMAREIGKSIVERLGGYQSVERIPDWEDFLRREHERGVGRGLL